MVTQITKGIKVSVESSFEGTYYKESKLHYAFEYSVKIENQSKELVQLDSRHWVILDSLNEEETVDGEGVIGKKPVLKPGQSHTYTSGCLLASPYGAMYGYYRMINLNSTKKFNVMIPVFKLSAPFSLN
ncbi:MAG: Co2+/Mg2+ efflux protein ApaG [Flavobacteriaceae bacterium]|jgi:ApaG protein|nr:Co2+/Mg2+ efflux protein ApaG [Flavobacteriaceae bacterium]MCH1485161.1 Co2+/Mg2+ efflux protein ApaG [Flavobacteriaceae bacterium]|tara:strand:- start:325 stop:711 length:387 start_codon:yes stop_codon:yes gene_type:complete